MSGRHDVICEAVSEYFPSNVRLGMTEMTRFILDNQFVRLAGEPGCFKVQCGAGMGSMLRRGSSRPRLLQDG